MLCLMIGPFECVALLLRSLNFTSLHVKLHETHTDHTFTNTALFYSKLGSSSARLRHHTAVVMICVLVTRTYGTVGWRTELPAYTPGCTIGITDTPGTKLAFLDQARIG